MSDQSEKPIDVGRSTVPSSYAHSWLKRGFDLFFAAGMLVLTLPILLTSVAWNFIVTRGHPLYVQRRSGRNGKEFGLIKLRTMRRPSSGEVWSHRTDLDDERLTLSGKLFRRTYIDELPQLLNVIRGQMSMVGPRPETLEMTLKIAQENPRFFERLYVKPGISGAAQIFFRKPENDDDLWRRYYYDHMYILRNNLRFDVLILLLTVWHVIRYKGH